MVRRAAIKVDVPIISDADAITELYAIAKQLNVLKSKINVRMFETNRELFNTIVKVSQHLNNSLICIEASLL
jgi:hypothetical protein